MVTLRCWTVMLCDNKYIRIILPFGLRMGTTKNKRFGFWCDAIWLVVSWWKYFVQEIMSELLILFKCKDENFIREEANLENETPHHQHSSQLELLLLLFGRTRVEQFFEETAQYHTCSGDHIRAQRWSECFIYYFIQGISADSSDTSSAVLWTMWGFTQTHISWLIW